MNLTLESLRILDAIDRKGSFAAAALALDRVPSALTYTVRKLEEDLDVLLIDRRGHRAKLTLAGGSADLAIGAAYDGPDAVRMTGEFRSRPLGAIEWVFAVAPSHPLAHVPEPLPTNIIQAHRAVAVGDTGRTLPGITAGLLSGQATLTKPSLQAKLAAQLAGLGCGHLPRPLAAPHLQSGALIAKETMDPRAPGSTQIAWRASARGKSLKWFLARLAEPAVQRMLLGQA